MGDELQDPTPSELEPVDPTQVALSDLLNRVLDKGLVVVGSVTISVADVDLVKLDVSIMLAALETVLERDRSAAAGSTTSNADLPLLPPE
jgi:gas vesicle structural protein